MAEYKVLAKKRNTRQIFMAGVFLVVLIGGWFYPLLGYFIPLCMLVGMGIGLFRGRKWCDWFCPRGSFFDAWIKPISPKRKIPQILKDSPLRIGILSFLMLMMAIQIVKRWPDPYKIGMFFVMLLTVTTILGIILVLIFHQRVWCCFCPIGSMANWVGRWRYPLRIDSNLCTECELCYKVCPIQVAPFKFRERGIETVKDGDCLKCGLCVSSCPKGALKLNGGEQ
jgi:polyferredoxin